MDQIRPYTKSYAIATLLDRANLHKILHETEDFVSCGFPAPPKHRVRAPRFPGQPVFHGEAVLIAIMRAIPLMQLVVH